jgi:N-formylglutamate amidohydrolase
MTDPRLEDHAVGVELQMTELVEQIERARVQGREARVAELQAELEALLDELAGTAETIASGHWPAAGIHRPRAT